jgi:hypothetical protein
MKQQKKQTKKEQMEREELIRDKIRDSQKYLSVLDTFGDDSIRNDFLNETNGAFVIFFSSVYKLPFLITHTQA